MKIQNGIIKGLSVALLLVIIVASFILPISASRFDYSSPNATSKVTLTSDELLEALFKNDSSFFLTQEEREYLKGYGKDTLTYGTRVPSSYITNDYDEDKAELTIKADAYSYKSSSGDITWIPSRVTFKGENYDFSRVNGEYVACISNANPGEEDNAEVLYKATVSFSVDFVNNLLNKAYNDGEAWSKYKSYVSELAEYKYNLSLYEEHLVNKQIFNDRYKEYQAYLVDKAEYDEAYALFLQYEKELAEYNVKYALFTQYTNDLKEYNENLLLYNKYVENIKVAEAQIATLLNTNKPLATIGRPLYGAIMGPTVTQVVENKDAIANELTGVGGEVVDMAGAATEKLKEILPDFHTLKNDADRYLYYSLNYEQIRVNFNNLFKSLDYLYKNGKVRLALGEMNMKEKYEIFLAQLYYVVLALNDAPVYDYEGKVAYNSSYKINGKTPKSLCEGADYTPDVSVAKPLSDGYPVKVEEPILPQEVEEPTRPLVVICPTKPEEVEEPKNPPVEVTRPTAPQVVNAPDSTLISADGSLPSGILSLIDAYNENKLIKRDELDGDAHIELFAYSSKRIVNVDSVVVNFYDKVGGSLLESIEAERGSYVEYSKTLPTKTAEDKIYTFVGWADEDGNLIDMTAINPSGDTLSLYPEFSWEYKSFEIGWNVLGDISYEDYYYGEIPEYKGSVPTKEDEGSYMFIFDGWSEEISTVTRNKTYIATFEKKPIVSDTNGNVGIISFDADEQLFVVDCSSSISKSFDLSAIFARAKEARVGVKLIMRAAVVQFQFSEIVKSLDSGATLLKLVSLKRGSEGDESYAFSLAMTLPDGTNDANIRATLTLPYVISNVERTTFCYDNEGVSEAVRYSATADNITISVNSGIQYNSVQKYSIGVSSSSEIPIEISGDFAKRGERVKISYTVPAGYRVISLYYIDQEGNTVQLSADILEMPATDIVIGISYEKITYTVKFISEGNVIGIATYKYGELPLPPGTPNIADDERYTYKFVGWDKEITPVDSDATYTAIYEKKEIEKEENSNTDEDKKDDLTGGLKITPAVMRILLLVVYAIAIIPPIIYIIIRVTLGICRRTKKRKNRK